MGRLFYASTGTDGVWEYDAFQYTVTDGLWTKPGHFQTVYNVQPLLDLPITINWRTKYSGEDNLLTSWSLTNSSLLFHQNNTDPSSITYTVTSNGRFVNIMLWGQLCDQTEGCQFTQFDVDNGDVAVAIGGEDPWGNGEDFVEFVVTDGVVVTEVQRLRVVLYSEPVVDLKNGTVFWNQTELNVTRELWSVSAPRMDGPDYVLYTLVWEVVPSSGFWKRWDGSRWNTLRAGDSWNQLDINKGFMKFVFQNETEYGWYRMNVTVSDEYTVTEVVLSVLFAAPLMVGLRSGIFLWF